MVELYVSEILSRASGDRVFIMILHEKDGMRKLPVLIGAFEAQSITFAKRNIHFERPITHDLFKNFAEAYGVTLKLYNFHQYPDVSEPRFNSKFLTRTADAEIS